MWGAALALVSQDLALHPWLGALAALILVLSALCLERISQGRPVHHRFDAMLTLPIAVIGMSTFVLAFSRAGLASATHTVEPNAALAALTAAILGVTAIGAAVRLLTRPFSLTQSMPAVNSQDLEPWLTTKPAETYPSTEHELPAQSAVAVPPTATPKTVLSTLGWCWELLAMMGAVALLAAGTWLGGPGLGIALATISASYVVRSLFASGSRRLTYQILAAVIGTTAWFTILAALDLTTAVVVDLTLIAGSVLTVSTALAGRWLARHAQLAAGFVVTAVTGVTLTAFGLITLYLPPLGITPHLNPGYLAGISVVALAAAAVIVADCVAGKWWRESAAVLVVFAIVLLLDAADATLLTRVIVLTAGAALTMVLVFWTVRGTRSQRWTTPLVLFSVLCTVTSLSLIGEPMTWHADDLMFVGIMLAIAAVQSAGFGVALRKPGLIRFAPILACASWLALARGAQLDGLQWYTAAIGLTLLVVAEIWRHTARPVSMVGATTPLPTDSGSPTEPGANTGPLVPIEVAGVGFLLIGPMIQSLTETPLHAFVGMGIGVAFTLWGIATRVRRRVRVGVVTVLAFVSALILIPLVKVLPTLGSAGLWVSIAVAGLVAVLVAALMERGKRAVRSGFARIWGNDPRWE